MTSIRHNTSGFTLMEIMLATIILAMIVSMVAVSLSGSLRVVSATRDQGNLYYRAQVALQRIGEDLESAVLIGDANFIGTPSQGPDQKQILIRFESMAHVDFAADTVGSSMGRISYALIPDPDHTDQMVLLRSDQAVTPIEESIDETEFVDGFILSDRLRSVIFSYYDQEGDEVDSWDTRAEETADEKEKQLIRRLPAAVSCRLEFWLDREEETTLTFQTMVTVPVGMIMPKGEKQ